MAWRAPCIRRAAAALAIGAAGASLGAAAATPPPAAVLVDHPRGLDGPWRVRGRLAWDPQSLAPNSRVDLSIDDIFVDGRWRRLRLRVRVAVYAPAPTDWAAGDGFETFLRLRADRPARNPQVRARPPSRAAGIDVRASLKSYRQLRRRENDDRPGLAGVRRAVRATVSDRFGAEAPFVHALLLGERGDLPGTTTSSFARTGLVHLLAISGLHIGVALGTLLLLARLGGLPPPGAALLTLVLLVPLNAMVVSRPAVLRASLMAAVMLTGVAIGRRIRPLDSLALASIALTAVDPWMVLDIGFQLSSTATAAILLVVPQPSASEARTLPTKLTATTIAAHAGTAPVLAATTYRLPLAGLALNPAAVPILAIVLTSAVATLVADAVGLGWIAAILATITVACLRTLQFASAAFDTLVSGLIVPPPLLPAVIIGSAAVLTVAAFRASFPIGAQGPRRGLGRLAGAGAIACAAVAYAAVSYAAAARSAPQRPPDSLRFVLFDVGQGDAILLETPDGEAVLVDTGGVPRSRFDPGTAILAPALRARGIARLDAVVITHFHADHAGGLAGLLAELPVGAVWVGGGAARRVEATLADATVAVPPIVGLDAGSTRWTERCAWAVLHPQDPPHSAAATPVSDGAADGPVSNDDSLVFTVECGGRGVLLTGDAEHAAEQRWARAEALGRVGVIKVAHHGSRTSSSAPLLDALEVIGARHATISVGFRNRFGHPDSQVLERYRVRQIAVYRTDRDGAVTVTSGRRTMVRGERWTQGRGRYATGGWVP